MGMIFMSIAEQKSLFDLNLKMVDATANEQFVDDVRAKLNKMVWQSLPRHTFFYDEDNNRKLEYTSITLRCDRRLKKNGKTEYLILRSHQYNSIDEIIEDEIVCSKIEELEQSFENEKDNFEAERLLPKDVLFDGQRYCWRFEKAEHGTIEFVEKWFAPNKDNSAASDNFEDDEDAILP
jgi:hypothetical protein